LLFLEPLNDLADLGHDVRLDALGRLVQDEQLRVERERPGDRELLLLAAREVAAAALEHGLEHREVCEQVIEALLAQLGVRPARRAQVLFDRELAEDLAALRHEADAVHGARLGGAAVEPLACELDLPARLEAAHDAAQQRGLTDAVAAHHDHALAGLYCQVDVPERVALAIELVEAFDVQDR
jgi:hypothetical protein